MIWNVQSEEILPIDELMELFRVVKVLGEGAFGKVYECVDKDTGETFAVKVIQKGSVRRSKLNNTKEEAGILAKINHPNVVQHYNIKETDTGIYIKMQVVKGGNLSSLIKERKKAGRPFNEEEVSKMMKAILSGVAHIHSLNIIHRDLKTQNILIDDPNDLSSLKIADFGLSIKVNYESSVSTQCGTFLYMAPEILLRTGYTKAVDIYSCAVVMYTLFSMGEHPFYKSNISTQSYTRIICSSQFPALSNQLANNFLQRIGRAQPLQRYKAHQTLKHPWITRRFDDPIPASIYQNFKGFEIHESIKGAFSALFLCHSVLLNPNFQGRQVRDSEYLKKVQHFNKESVYRLKRQTPSSYGTRLSRDSLPSSNKIINNNTIVDAPLHKQQTAKQYNTHNPAIQKLNLIFTTLFEKKSDSKSNLVEGAVDSGQSIGQSATSAIQKIQQLIQRSAIKFRRQSANKRKMFQKKESKSICKLSSTTSVSRYVSRQGLQQGIHNFKPNRTSIRLREPKVAKKSQDLKRKNIRE